MDNTVKSIKPYRKKIRKSGLTLLLMALPFIIFLIMFCYVPLFGWLYAFFDYKPGIPISITPFVGLKFFKMIFDNWDDVSRALGNTFKFFFLGLLTAPLAPIVAILLNEVRIKRFKKLVQVTTTIPNFISWVIVFSMMFSIFSNEGLLNKIAMGLGIISRPTNLLGNADAVYLFQTALAMWKGLGWGSIIYLAAIAGIDEELYSAAKVDGAGRLRSILHITVPGLMPTFVVLMLLYISSMLSSGFDQLFVFKNPMIIDKIEVLDLYLFRMGIANGKYSYAIAAGIIKMIIGLVLLFSVNNLAKRVRGDPII